MLIKLGQGISPQFTKKKIRFLDEVITSTIADLDATILDSYDGSSQTWRNLIKSPADGSAQIANDFSLGANTMPSTDDPTFIGAAGSRSAHFFMDGGDFFQIDGAVNTPFLRDMHKTTGGSDFWFACVMNLPTGNQTIFSTGAFPSHKGILLNKASERAYITQFGDSAAVSQSDPRITPLTDVIVIYSYSHLTNTARFWTNSRTKAEKSLVFNTTTVDARFPLQIGAANSGARMLNGAKVYAASYGNAFLDDADVSKIFDLLNQRHGRVYA